MKTRTLWIAVFLGLGAPGCGDDKGEDGDDGAEAGTSDPTDSGPTAAADPSAGEAEDSSAYCGDGSFEQADVGLLACQLAATPDLSCESAQKCCDDWFTNGICP